MANARPSRPGNSNPIADTSKMEPQIPVDITVGINEDGQTDRRKILDNGNIIDTHVFPGDFPNAEKFAKPKSEAAQKVAADRKASTKSGS